MQEREREKECVCVCESVRRSVYVCFGRLHLSGIGWVPFQLFKQKLVPAASFLQVYHERTAVNLLKWLAVLFDQGAMQSSEALRR